MAFLDLDPLTGLPKSPSKLNTPVPTTGPISFYPTGAGTGTGGGAPTGVGATPSSVPPTQQQYQDMLEADPFYRQSLADLTAESVSDRAGLSAARRQAIIRFGADEGSLAGLGDLGGDIDPATLSLAQQNTQAGLSTTARMEKAYKDSLRGLRNTLAARGALRSGELGHQLGELDLSKRQVGFDARNQLMDALSGYAAGFANAERQRAAARAAAAGGAAARGVAQPPPAGAPPPPPPAPPPMHPSGDPDEYTIPDLRDPTNRNAPRDQQPWVDPLAWRREARLFG